MGFLKVVKRAIQNLDLFSSIQLLRFRGESQTKTYTGGLISLALILYAVSIFLSMVIDTFHKDIINSAQYSEQPPEPEPIYLLTTDNASHFMLGIEVWQFDLNSGPRFFDVNIRNSFRVDGTQLNKSVDYAMQPCTIGHWQGIQNVSKFYDKINMNYWLCMPLDISPVLEGKYYSDVQTTLDIQLRKCNNQTDPSRPCAPQEQIDAYLVNNGPLYFTPYFINPQINSQTQNYLNFYLQDRYYTMFGVDYGMEMYVFNAGYQITTDESIFPFSDIHTQNGSVVNSVSTNAYNMGNSTDYYAYIRFLRDPTTLTIKRSYQRITDVFSYLGGLLSSLMLLLIFLNVYNQSSYEMRFTSLYKQQKDAPITAKKFNIFYYFLESLYSLLQIIKVNCERWKAVKYFSDTREEMVRQMDVKYLFKKLHILQNAIMLLLTKSQLKGLMLQHEMTVPEAKKMRRFYGLKNKIKRLYRKKLNQGPEKNKKQSSLHLKTTSGITQQSHKKNQPSIANSFYDNTLKTENFIQYQLSSSESDDSSEQSQGQNFTTFSLQLAQDLNELKQQSLNNNKMSSNILKNIDPFIKHIYEAYSQQKELNSFNRIDKREYLTAKNFIQVRQARRTTRFNQTQQNISPQKYIPSSFFQNIEP